MVQQFQLFCTFFNPFFFPSHSFPKSGSDLFAGSFLLCCFHIDKKLNVNISLAKVIIFCGISKQLGRNLRKTRKKVAGPFYLLINAFILYVLHLHHLIVNFYMTCHILSIVFFIRLCKDRYFSRYFQAFWRKSCFETKCVTLKVAGP